jgi:AraC-like DNA-binding protein
MQRFADNLPRVAHSAGTGERVTISFRTQPGPSLLWGGAEMLPTNIVRHGEGGSPFQRSSGSACWGAMSLPVADAVAIGETLGGRDLTRPKQTQIVTPAPSVMAKLQRLHEAAGHLAEEAPEIIANPDSARGLEQALVEAMVGCLAGGEAREHSAAQRQHAIVMRRFRRVVEDNPGQPLYIPDICRTIRVSERTLRMCCQEQLGMSPKRYLLLRRMRLARRALREAAPGTTSVTAIGTRYGFWELGRFAVEYQALFGEPPSATLRRQPE